MNKRIILPAATGGAWGTTRPGRFLEPCGPSGNWALTDELGTVRVLTAEENRLVAGGFLAHAAVTPMAPMVIAAPVVAEGLTRYDPSPFAGEMDAHICGDYYRVGDVDALLAAHPVAGSPAEAKQPHWTDGPQSALGGKSAREGYAANPEYATPAAAAAAESMPASEAPEGWKQSYGVRQSDKAPEITIVTVAGQEFQLWSNELAHLRALLNTAAPVPASEAASIDAPEFRELLGDFGNAVMVADKQTRANRLIAYINSNTLAAPAAPTPPETFLDNVTELDVLVNGVPTGAGLAALVETLRSRQSVQLLKLDDGMRANFRAPDGRRATMFLDVVVDDFARTGRTASELAKTMRAAVDAYPVAGSTPC